jgi:periplasmic copper chaperone A
MKLSYVTYRFSTARHSARLRLRTRSAGLLLSLFALVSASAQAQVAVKEPWVRATVAQQKSTGAFMQLTSQQDAKLIEVKSPAAKIVEIHEMKMDNNVMKMRPIDGLALPAGKGVELKPGGYHVMMIDLNQTLKEGDTVPLALVIETADGKRQTIDVKAMVRPLTSRPVDNSHHKH